EGNAAPAAATTAASAVENPPPPPVAAPSAPPPVAASANLSPEVQKQVAAGKKWSKSTIAAEQARRKRNSLPPLNDAEITALLGEPLAPAAAAAAPAAATPAAAARPAAPAAGQA